MSLSSDLLSQFAKITKDETKNSSETTVYGTVVEYNGTKYVRLDGSELLTPITSVANIYSGERVSVMIKNHSATVTGNITSPSARVKDLKDVDDIIDKISEFEIVVADKVSTTDFDAMGARVEELRAEQVTIKDTLKANDAEIDSLKVSTGNFTEHLSAVEADIDALETNKLDVTVADAKYATISDLEATNADIHNLEATYGDFEVLVTNNFTSVNADIDRLEADKLDASVADITYAQITELDSAIGRISDLEAEVGDIDTLIFGSATGTTIQSSFANAVIAQLGNAQIKSAMIDSVSADKITTGDIITNNVRVMSGDGKLVISDETIQISDDTRVRVQIGKDAAGDYSIHIWDADGKLMFSEGGITDNAIKSAIIRNDMVSETANISASKLDIDSLFEEINNSEKTIISSRVYLDDGKQTLDVAFKTLHEEVTDVGSTVASQGTKIETIQGQITSKVWQQDINTAKNDLQEETSTLSTKYSTLEQKLDSVSTTVAEHTSEIANKADSSTVTAVNDRVTDVETSLDGFKTTVSETYATKLEMGNIKVGGRNYVLNSDEEKTVSNHYALYKLSDAKSALQDQPIVVSFDAKRSEDSAAVNVYAYFRGSSSITPNSNKIGDVTYEYERYYVTIEPGAIIDDATHISIHAGINGSAMSVRNVKLEIGTLATDWSPAPEDIDADIATLTSRMSSAETSISQNTKAIELRATQTEVATAKAEAISSANSNTATLLEDYSTTSEMEAAIKLESDSITSSVRSTYATISALSATNDNVSTAQAAADAAQESIDNLEVGGRNYLLDSEYERICAKSILDFSLTKDLDWLKTKAGETVVLSFEAKGNEECDYQIDAYFRGDVTTFNTGNPVHNLTTEYTRYSQIMTIPTIPDDDTVVTVRIRGNQYVGNQENTGNFYIRNTKLEFGNVATDWTPAPEDMATAKEVETAQTTADEAGTVASNAETLVKQLSDSISTLVTDGNGTSLMTQTDDGWMFSTADIQTAINNTSEGLDSLVNELGSTNSAVDILQRAVDDLGVLSDYIKIGAYDDEPCIELGESDSEFKLRITNTRIMFMEGSGIPAYFSNQSMHIKKAVVEEELQQGGFVWKVRSNGNMGLVWKGVSN